MCHCERKTATCQDIINSLETPNEYNYQCEDYYGDNYDDYNEGDNLTAKSVQEPASQQTCCHHSSE